ENIVAAAFDDGAVARVAGAGCGFEHALYGKASGGCKAVDHGGGVVAGVVVDDQAFGGNAFGQFEPGDTGERRLEHARAVMGWNGDGYLRVQGVAADHGVGAAGATRSFGSGADDWLKA